MDSFEISCQLPARADVVYAAWLNSEIHSEFTGGLAAIQDEIDSKFTTWDGYITGRILKLEPNSKIIQSWRTTDFHMDDDDSMVEVEFVNKGEGCVLYLRHWNIPEGQSAKYMSGWNDHYFLPMRAYFSK